MPILCYHSIDPAWGSPMANRPEEFERHCRWLARAREVVDLGAQPESWRSVYAGRLVALTFDDAYAALYEYAFPILKRYRLPALVFVVAETLTVKGRPVDWVDDLPDYPLETLSVAQALEMQEAGITFGSHSLAHRDLTALSDHECERDLRSAREVIEDSLGKSAPTLAYPRGRHSERVRRAAVRAGYSYAFTLPDRREPADDLRIPRVGVYRGNGMATLKTKTVPGYLRVRSSIYPLWRRMAAR